MKIKAKEIAKAMNLSAATVSLALNGKPGVNEETRKKVLDYAHRIQFEEEESFVKLVAFKNMELQQNGNNQGGEIQRTELHTIFQLNYMGMVERVQREGMEVKLIYAEGKKELKEILEKSNRDGTRGLLVYAEEMSREEQEMLSICEIPIVISDAEMRMANCDIVNVNNRQAVLQGMEYLEDHGCRRIVYFSNEDSIHNFRERRRAFKLYLEENPRIEGEIVQVGSNLFSIAENIERFVAENKKLPDGIFMENFLISIGTVNTLHKLGIRIPEDISVLGIDAVPGTVILPVELTYFEVFHGERGRIMADILIEHIHSGEKIKPKEILLNEEFHEGKSVKLLS